MPLGDPYGTGTISIAAGATTATGTGVYWKTIKPFDVLSAGGAVAFIEAITDQVDYNDLSIFGPWGGPSLVAQPYRIIKFPTGGIETTERVREVFDLIVAGRLFHFVAADEQPAEDLADDGHWALRPSDWATWLKVDGEWVQQVTIGSIPEAVAAAQAAATTAGDARDEAEAAVTAAAAQVALAVIQTGLATTQAVFSGASATTSTTQAGIATGAATTATTQAGIATTKAADSAASASEADGYAETLLAMYGLANDDGDQEDTAGTAVDNGDQEDA